MADIWAALITTVGALAGSFGGFTLAARAQRRQADQDNARASQEAERARSVMLDDERHEFQLTTLIGLQELTRLRARHTLLVIQEDRARISSVGGYRMLATEDPEDFASSIKFGHTVARVTNAELREKLESFSRLSAEYRLPPLEASVLSQDEALAVQERRFLTLIQDASEAAALLNEHLRKELDRTAI